MENRVLKISKVFFNVLVLDAVQDLIFTTVENKFSGDGTIAMFCLGTFFRVDQMAVLDHNPHMTPSEAEKRNRSLGSKKSILT